MKTKQLTNHGIAQARAGSAGVSPASSKFLNGARGKKGAEGTCRRDAGAPRGFTLVEMLLVLVILGVLAAIVYPRIAGRGEQARIQAAKTQIASFKTALNLYEVDNGGYPKGRNGLLDLIQKPRDAVSWKGPYLDSIPKDPWQNDYIYEFPGKHNPTSFDIMSMGPDGRANTDDDIGNWETK